MLKKSLVAMLAALMLAGAALAATANAAPKPANVAVPVTGTFTDALGGTGTVTGTDTVDRLGPSGGARPAVGPVPGTAVTSRGATVGTATQAVTVPLQAAGTCDILHLTLGPLDLN